MSREIKFRAWDKARKEYWGPYDFLNDETLPRPIRNMVVEQYTGLEDVNGKEIYEGDIVTLNGEWEEIEHDDCSIVTFENGCFRVGDGYENEAGSYLSDWRIIGNIHEDPELLEVEYESV